MSTRKTDELTNSPSQILDRGRIATLAQYGIHTWAQLRDCMDNQRTLTAQLLALSRQQETILMQGIRDKYPEILPVRPHPSRQTSGVVIPAEDQEKVVGFDDGKMVSPEEFKDQLQRRKTKLN